MDINGYQWISINGTSYICSNRIRSHRIRSHRIRFHRICSNRIRLYRRKIEKIRKIRDPSTAVKRVFDSKKWSPIFSSYSRPSEVVGTSYLVGLVLHTCFSKKNCGLKFFSLCQNFRWVFTASSCPKASAKVLRTKIPAISVVVHTHTKKPITIRKNIKTENFDLPKIFPFKQVHKINPTKYEVPTTSDGRE